jgi:S-adenosylmethionine synthetase
VEFVTGERRGFDIVRVDLNTLDDESRGEEGMYLTVLGTSAEGADCGQVGRGNKVNGVIALNRPMSTEAAAGKNPVSHVGKIYTLLTHRIAQEIHRGVPGIREVYVWLCSQIGRPIDEPLIASAQLTLARGVSLTSVKDDVERLILRELDGIYDFTTRLSKGEYPVW